MREPNRSSGVAVLLDGRTAAPSYQDRRGWEQVMCDGPLGINAVRSPHRYEVNVMRSPSGHWLVAVARHTFTGNEDRRDTVANFVVMHDELELWLSSLGEGSLTSPF